MVRDKHWIAVIVFELHIIFIRIFALQKQFVCQFKEKIILKSKLYHAANDPKHTANFTKDFIRDKKWRFFFFKWRFWSGQVNHWSLT